MHFDRIIEYCFSTLCASKHFLYISIRTLGNIIFLHLVDMIILKSQTFNKHQISSHFRKKGDISVYHSHFLEALIQLEPKTENIVRLKVESY